METMQPTHTPQRALVKLLAIIGFFAFVVLILWGLVQGIRAFPSAFSSLASIAESINNYRPAPELEITTEKNVINSGEVFTITWTDMGKGSYRFNFECEDQMLVKVRTGEGTLRDLSCTDDLSLPEEVHGLFASIEGGEQRFSEQTFSITFINEDGEEVTKDKSVTIVNATMPTFPAATGEETEDAPVVVATSTPVTPAEQEPEPTPAPVAETPKPAPAVKPAIVAVPSYPVSNPNGYTDLEITFLGTGRVVNGAFISQTSFDEDTRAAFRFQVKNIGTKTSNSWKYELGLPERDDYTGPVQSPLRPTEYAIFTVGFDLSEDSKKTITLEGSISTTGETNTRNNSFERTVKVSD